jgi:phosphopantetheine adenylyltransferase
MFDAASRNRLGEHAVYPGTFDPVTPGHIDIIERARHLFPRGVRNGSDLRHECQLAAMNEAMGITTLLLPAKPRLAAVSSTVVRGLST